MKLRNPLAEVRGLGSAKEGPGDWWNQRLTAVLLLPLSIWFLFAVAELMVSDYADARFFLLQPWNAFLMMAFILTLIYHAMLGLQVIIEDYIHLRWLEVFLLVALKLASFLLALGSIYSLLRIVMGV